MRTAPPLWFDGRNHGRSALLVACANAGMTAEQALDELLKLSDGYQAQITELLETRSTTFVLDGAEELLRRENERLRAELAQLKAELSALRPLSEAGTQGEWRSGNVDTDCVFVQSTHADAMGPERVLLRTNQHFEGYERDASLIAAAVNAVRRMLAREGGDR